MKVSKEAREAAAFYAGYVAFSSAKVVEDIESGRMDSYALVQSFARFEAETMERAAKIADDLSDKWDADWKARYDMHDQGKSDGAHEVATALRAQKDDEV